MGLMLFIHLFFLINLKFTAWPEMTSYAYLYNNGFTLYKDFILPYPPLLIWILASLYKLFGYNIWVLKLLSWTLSLTNSLLVYVVVKKITKKQTSALLSLASYIFLQPFLEGNMLWFDNVITTPLLVGLYFLLPKRNLFLAGFFLALAALTKQTAGIFILASAIYITWETKRTSNLKHLFTAPFFLGWYLFAYIILHASLSNFLTWTLWNPIINWSEFPGYVQMSLTNREVTIVTLLFFPLVFLFRSKSKKDISLPLLFLSLSLLAIYPRFSFFHFQPALAFICVLFGFLPKRITPLFFAAYLLLLIPIVQKPVIAHNWQQEARFWKAFDLALAQAITREVKQNETVFLLGPHSGLYSMSGRLPPKPWTENFGWYLEIEWVQGNILFNWQNHPPDYVIWTTPKEGNWFDLAVYQPKLITSWIKNNYTKKKEIQKGTYIWQRKN